MREWLKNVLYLIFVNLNEHYLKIFVTAYEPVSVKIKIILNFLIIVEKWAGSIKKTSSGCGMTF